MTLKHTLAALCLAAGLLHSAAAQTVLRYSDHEPLYVSPIYDVNQTGRPPQYAPYGNMRTRFINDVFFKHAEAESGGRIKIEPHWDGSIAQAHDELQALADGKTDLIVAVPEYSAEQLPLNQLFKGFMIGPAGAQQVQTLRRIYADIPELAAEYQKNGATPLIIATGYPVAFLASNRCKPWTTSRDKPGAPASGTAPSSKTRVPSRPTAAGAKKPTPN